LDIKRNRDLDDRLCNWEIQMKNMILRFIRDESGVTAIEYGLIAALVSVVAIAGFTTIGTNLAAKLVTISASL
jgi:pilus assembly protein Flp/PilA